MTFCIRRIGSDQVLCTSRDRKYLDDLALDLTSVMPGISLSVTEYDQPTTTFVRQSFTQLFQVDQSTPSVCE